MGILLSIFDIDCNCYSDHELQSYDIESNLVKSEKIRSRVDSFDKYRCIVDHSLPDNNNYIQKKKMVKLIIK
tara:strand:- start:399 stop:614 length:216 start_codon:yes stop_codon:yes gene_type:complete